MSVKVVTLKLFPVILMQETIRHVCHRATNLCLIWNITEALLPQIMDGVIVTGTFQNQWLNS
jgi:hypothetical protein